MLVSIVMPAYNAAQFIAESIHSVLNQTYSDWELLIIDDGSTDATADVVQTFSDPRIRYVWQENQERSRARNHGLRLATGVYLAFLDSDDCWHPTFLQTHVDYLEANPTIDITCSWVYEVDTAGEVVSIMRPGFAEDLSCEEAWNRLLRANHIMLGATLMRRNIATIDFDPRLRQGEDWDYCLRLARHHRIHTIQEPLTFYRRYGSYMPARRLARNSEEMVIYMLDKALADSDQALRDDALGYAYWEMAWLSYATARIDQGKTYMACAYRLAPNHFDDDDHIIQRVAYFADELYDLDTPMDDAVAHLTRFFTNFPAIVAHKATLLNPTIGFYGMLALFRAHERSDWRGVRSAGNLILQKRPGCFRNRGAASLYLRSLVKTTISGFA